MEKRVEGLVRQFRDARRHRLRFEALVTALSVLVTGGVFWQLRKYGTALGESAPETAQPGAGGTVVETDADPPEETTRSGIAESPEDWEAGLPEFTDETTQQRIAAIAVSQLGYSEGGEIKLSDVGTSRTGYTRYGAWYGNPYGEWNTMFTYFCMYYAGVEKTEIPYGSGCWAWYETLSEKDMIAPCGNEQIGDILFFDTDSDGEPDRTGIVSGTGETEDGVLLSVIEGNCEGAVAEVQYLRGGSDMLGVLSADAYAVAEVSLPPEVVLIDYSADSGSGIHVDAQAAEGVFPEGTVMKAVDVAEDEAVQAAQDTLGENAAIRDAVAVDISFYTADGEEIEPADGNAVSVQISLPAEMQLSGDIYTLVHVDDEGEGELVADAQVDADGAVFTAESFSTYVVTSANTTKTFENGETISLKVGESITLTAENTSSNDYDYFRVDGNWNSTDRYVYLTPAVYNPETYQAALDAGIYHVRTLADGREMHDVTFTAEHVADESVGLKIKAPNGEEYPVIIRDAAIMVKSSHGFKDIDRVREQLGRYDGAVYDAQWLHGVWFGRADPEGYDYAPNTKNEPYQIEYNGTVPDPFVFYSETTQRIADPNYAFRFYAEDGDDVTAELLTPTDPSDPRSAQLVVQEEEYEPGHFRYTATLTPQQASYADPNVYLGDNEKYRNVLRGVFQGTNREFWIKIWEPALPGVPAARHQMMNHADMEIADGGTYSLSETSFDDDGNCIITVKVYQADIVYVNDAYIYGRDGSVLQHYTSAFDENDPVYMAKVVRDDKGNIVPGDDGLPQYIREDGEVVPDYDYPVGDYESYGKPGDKQYEFTSAWIHNSVKGNHKTYDITKVDKATFDVNLMLTPRKEYTYVIPKGGTIGEPTIKEYSEEEALQKQEKKEHMTFWMDHQDVIDAQNKCPNNNGLDFTARAEYTILSMPVYKDMANGSLSDDQYTYDILDLNAPDYRLFTSSTPTVSPGVYHTNENLVEIPDVSLGGREYHDFAAFEAFTPDGEWGAGVDTEKEVSGLTLLQALRKAYNQADQPFENCNSAADVFNIVTSDSTDDAVKELFAETAVKYQSGVYAGNQDGKYFDNGREGYLVILDNAVIAETATVKVDKDENGHALQHGQALFQNMRFFLPPDDDSHDFEFAVHERRPLDSGGINYDERVIHFIVRVERKDGFLIARPIIQKEKADGSGYEIDSDATDVVFQNFKVYLPDTGGTGTLPYLAGGTILISAAFLLPLIRRRKEDECDS